MQKENEDYMKLIVASHNEDKVNEIKAILTDLSLEVISLAELAYDEEIEENGNSFVENALIKVRAIRKHYPEDYIMADDSGLAVSSLDGAPGIYSARFGGKDSSYEEKFVKLRELMAASGSDDKSAVFHCAIAVVRPDGSEFTVEGTLEGEIVLDAKGINGFGYDPIFYLPEYGMTTAELEPTLKNRLSHRAKALMAMREVLIKELL